MVASGLKEEYEPEDVVSDSFTGLTGILNIASSVVSAQLMLLKATRCLEQLKSIS